MHLTSQEIPIAALDTDIIKGSGDCVGGSVDASAVGCGAIAAIWTPPPPPLPPAEKAEEGKEGSVEEKNTKKKAEATAAVPWPAS